MLAQVGLKRTPIGVTETTCAHHPIGKTALRQVRASLRISPQRVAVERTSCVEHELLLQSQPVPPPVVLSRFVTWPASSCSRRRRLCQRRASLPDRAQLFSHTYEVNDVAARLAAEAD